MTLATLLMCNLQTRNHFQKKSRNQVDYVTDQPHFLRVIPSVSVKFTPFQEVKKIEAPDFFHGKLG